MKLTPSRDPETGCRFIGPELDCARRIFLVNPTDSDWTRHKYVLGFGAYRWTRLMVWANSLDEALDICIDWISEYEPGLLCDDAVNEAYNEAIEAGHDEETAQEIAHTDVTVGGNYGNAILSYEWGILAEDPSRAELAEMVGGQ